jgi:5-methyltetrahydrofolate--homocysteine methyltransferase
MADNPMTEAAKELRKRPTEAEKRLWFKLRESQADGLKFRRQEPIGKYIVDFVNFENKLVIEIDGGIHQRVETRKEDQQRTAWLKSEGFRVIRFWNSSVLNNLDDVVKKIKKEVKHGIHPHLTSPIKGEE